MSLKQNAKATAIQQQQTIENNMNSKHDANVSVQGQTKRKTFKIKDKLLLKLAHFVFLLLHTNAFCFIQN